MIELRIANDISANRIPQMNSRRHCYDYGEGGLISTFSKMVRSLSRLTIRFASL